MKKLMIATVATVVGIAAQASSVAWTCTNVKDASGDLLTKGCAYVFFVQGETKADTSSWASLAGKGASALSTAVAGANFDYKKSDLTANDGVFSYNATTAGAAIPLADVGLTGSTKYSVYAVIFDTDTITDASKFYVTTATAASTTMADSSANTKSYSLTATSSATASNWYAVSVPEPTSGLLLLLGFAGLALKRKRA